MSDREVPRIHAIGTHVPARRESNLDRAAAFGFQSDFLKDVLGFVARSVKESHETTSDLCVRAFEDLQTHCEFQRETCNSWQS